MAAWTLLQIFIPSKALQSIFGSSWQPVKSALADYWAAYVLYEGNHFHFKNLIEVYIGLHRMAFGYDKKTNLICQWVWYKLINLMILYGNKSISEQKNVKRNKTDKNVLLISALTSGKDSFLLKAFFFHNNFLSFHSIGWRVFNKMCIRVSTAMLFTALKIVKLNSEFYHF